MKLYEWARKRGLATQTVALALMGLRNLIKPPRAIISLTTEEEVLLEIEFASRTPPIQQLAPQAKKPNPPAARSTAAAGKARSARGAARYSVHTQGADPEEFEALDESDAVSQYVKLRRFESHRHQFRVTRVKK